MSRRWWAAAALLFAVAAWGSEGHHQGDEHFQILEFAGYKLGLATADDLPWEFHERMRPALQPAIAYATYQVVGLGGPANPFTVALMLRLLSAVFTLLVARSLWRRCRHSLPEPLRRPFLLALLFHWCAYYCGVRFSSENWSGLTAVIAMLLYPLPAVGTGQFLPAGGRSVFGAGVLFGVAFLFRYQAALLVAGFGLWLLVVRREHWSRLLACTGGGLLALLVAYPLTYWLYGTWTLPAWNYFAQNLVAGKAAGYGILPWYGYVELVLLRGIPPVSLLYLGGFGYFCYAYRRDPLAWAGLVFVLVHSLLGRKDIRFLFPLVPLLPVYVAGAAAALHDRYGAFWHGRWIRIAGWTVVAVNVLLLLSVLLRPAASEIGPSRFVYDTYPSGVRMTGPQPQIIRAEGAVSRFYHRPATVVDTAESAVAPVDSTLPLLWLDHTRDRPSPAPGARLVYAGRPAWLAPLNVGGWLDRQKWWYIYALPDG
ncbi:glycosyltransferase family 39 protein [Lewinella sp. IMCC34183]|uniref:glycosyltransferase family 39 protein n=1 Tax=Lewinella sp. IMCC34183 TaxID=2248762 RepID=UPI000E280E80|nr:glycosyltransferase family 39 protein [Lewinella sp. IMCC34183]